TGRLAEGPSLDIFRRRVFLSEPPPENSTAADAICGGNFLSGPTIRLIQAIIKSSFGRIYCSRFCPGRSFIGRLDFCTTYTTYFFFGFRTRGSGFYIEHRIVGSFTPVGGQTDFWTSMV